MNDLFVVDTSVVIERAVSRLIKKKEIMGTIIIPNAVVAELEHQANKGQETGLMGIEELQNLQELKKQGEIELKFVGQRPNLYQIRYAKAGGEIDALIRDLAHSEGATLITGDKIQAESAKAFDRNIDKRVPRIILVDTFNREIDDTIATARGVPSLAGARIRKSEEQK